ncbi:hypothetical protein [Flexithrix dorotheae]|uniref:hypothetical protein n=1 Tax=Flexithrix dorotheae TaxID=70993 RepID=UPI00035D4006|nr:hypothetical protein [Flexithrix dorotheae]
MKKIKLNLTAFLLFNFNFLFAQQSDLVQFYQDGMRAYEEKDFSRFLKSFKKAHEIRPNHPTILYNLAAAFALNDSSIKALETLDQLIVINANPEIARDKDFNTLKELPEFHTILQKIDSLNKPENKGNTLFTLPDKFLHPESVAYDSKTGRYFISSIRKRKIVVRSKDGNTKDFSHPEDSLLSVSGMKIDKKNRLLWACSAAFPEMENYMEEDKGKAKLLKYDLDKGKLLATYHLKNDGKTHYFGDLVLHPNGDVYVSDSGTPAIYKLESKGNQLQLYHHFKNLVSLQGLTFSKDGKQIFLADYLHGIFCFPISNPEALKRINCPKELSLKGIDGLYFYKNALIITQNGIKPKRVSQFFLDDKFEKVKKAVPLVRAVEHYEEPTLGVIVKNDFIFVANSPWAAYDKDKNLKEDLVAEPIIVKVKLSKK